MLRDPLRLDDKRPPLDLDALIDTHRKAGVSRIVVSGGIWLALIKLWTALGTIGQAIVSSLALHYLSSLLQKPALDIGDTSRTYGFEAQRNTIGLGAAVPVVYGRHRQHGHVIQAYVETIDDEDWYNILLLHSEGQISGMTDIELNDQAEDHYTDVDLEVRLGTATQTAIPWFTDSRNSFPVSVVLNTDADVFTYGTNAEIDAFVVRVNFPSGMVGQNQDEAGKVTVRVEYRVTGTTPYTSLGDFVIAEKKMASTFSRSFRKDHLVRDFYDIRVTRLATSYGTAPMTWASIDEIIYGAETYPNLALLGVRVKATEQLSGGMPQVSALIEGMLVRPLWVKDSPAAGELSASGMGSFSAANALDDVQTTKAWDTDAATSGAWVKIDLTALGTPTGPKEFTRLRLYLDAVDYAGVYSVQYSDNGTDWTNALTGWNPRLLGWNAAKWSRLGAHAYWRLLLSNTPGAGPDIMALEMFRPITSGEMATVIPTWTQNPWACVLDVLTNVRYGRGRRITDDMIDVDSFATEAAYADELIPDPNGVLEERFQLDYVADQRVDWRDTVRTMLATCRGTLVESDLVYRAFTDRPTAVSQVFGNVNMLRGSFRNGWVPLREEHNQIETAFIDETKEYVRESVMYPPAGTVLEPKVKTLQLYGITRPSQALREAKYHLNVISAISRYVEFDAFLEAVAVDVGDVIDVSHDIPLWGYNGRVLAASTAGGATTIEIDRDDLPAPGTGAAIRIRHANDQREDGVVVDLSGRTLTISPALAQVPVARDSIWAYAPTSATTPAKPFRVLAAGLNPDLTKRLTAAEYDEDVYDLSGIAFPDRSPSLLPNFAAPPAVVESLTAAEMRIIGPDSSVLTYLDVSWNIPEWVIGTGTWEYARVYQNLYQGSDAAVEGGSWTFVSRVDGTRIRLGPFPVNLSQAGSRIKVRVVAVSTAGVAGVFAAAPTATVVIGVGQVGIALIDDFTYAVRTGDEVDPNFWDVSNVGSPPNIEALTSHEIVLHTGTGVGDSKMIRSKRALYARATTATSATSPGTLANDPASGGAVAWTTPGNAASSDDSRTTADATPATSPGSEGPRGPSVAGTIQAEVDDVPWSGLAYPFTSNDQHATVSLIRESGESIPKSERLRLTTYGFNIPTGATIAGIEFRLERKAFGVIRDYEIYLSKAGSVAGSNKAITGTNWPSSDAVVVYGGPNDLWGTTWADTDINGSGFGAFVRVQLPSVGSSTAAVDLGSITVYYIVGGGTGTILTQYLKVTNFGFAVPLDATISSVEVEVERSKSGSGTSRDRYVKLIKGAGPTYSTEDRALTDDWPGTDAYASYEFSAYAFGATALTPADVNASTFGAVIAAHVAPPTVGTETARIDHVRITVNYVTSPLFRLLRHESRWKVDYSTWGNGDWQNGLGGAVGYTYATHAPEAYIARGTNTNTVKFVTYASGDATPQTTDNLAVDPTIYHRYAIEIDGNLAAVRLYADGTLLATHATKVGAAPTAVFKASNSAAEDRHVTVDFSMHLGVP